jgi:DNA polymerase-1
LQVARGSIRVLFVGVRGKAPTLYDEAAVEERFGVPPRQLPSWIALAGDPSDNLPKMPGVGPRTATRLVREFGNIRNLLARVSEVLSPKLREDLPRHAEQLLLNEELATLEEHVPVGTETTALPLTARAFARMRELLVELEFRSLVPRLEAIAHQGETWH